MRILYLVHQYFPRHIGGTEVFTQGLASRMKEANNEVLIVCCHEAQDVANGQVRVEKTEHDGIPLWELHFNLSTFANIARCEYYNQAVGRTVEDILNNFHPDIVHNMHSMKLSIAAFESCVRRNLPVITSLCDFWLICPRHSLLTWDNKTCSGADRLFKCVPCLKNLHGYPALPDNVTGMVKFCSDLISIEQRTEQLRTSILKSKRIIALSNFQKNLFVQNGYPKKRIEVMQHGIEMTALETHKRTAENQGNKARIVLGFIGSIVEPKGLHLAMDAFMSLKSQKLELRIYGKILDNAYCKRIRDTAAKDERIKFLGEFPPADFGNILSDLDALLVPALWYENEPLVVKAAQFIGLPIVLSKIGSLAEMIIDKENGTLVELGDIAGWRNAIEACLNGTLPKPDCSAVKSIDQNAEEFLQIYKMESQRCQ